MAVSRTIHEAMSEEDFQLWDEGKSIRKKAPPVRDVPKVPKEEHQIELSDIDLSKVAYAITGRRRITRNKEGVVFILFDVALKMAEGKDLEGWMNEGDYVEMKRLLFFEDTVNTDNLE